MTRLLPVTVLAILLAANGVAHGQQETPVGPLANGAAIGFMNLKIHENNSTDLVFPKVDPNSLWNYFNLAHCQCGKPGVADPSTYREGTFAYLLTLTGATGPVARPLELWVGANCSDPLARPQSQTATCHLVKTLDSVDLLTNPGNVQPEIPVYDFMTPVPTATACPLNQGTSTLWAMVDTTGNGVPDYFVSQPLATDSAAPPLPTEFSAAGGDQAIEISFKPPPDASDVYAYQALCARADDGSPGLTANRPAQLYMTAHSLCGAATSIDLGPGTGIIVRGGPDAGVDAPTPIDAAPVDATPVDAGATDAGTIDAGAASAFLPPGLDTLEPAFLCGKATTPTDTKLRIDGLQNDVPYKIVFLVVDKFQNARGTFFTTTLTPTPSTDLWEDLHDRNSKVKGGLCLLAETYGDGSSLTGALRSFRDSTLGGSRAGRWLARMYYATLGKLGALVHHSIALRIVAAIALAPLVVFALLWHWLTLPGALLVLAAPWLWRRRAALRRWSRRLPLVLMRLARLTRLARTLAVLAIVVLSAGRAYAGGGYQPYWEDSAVKTDESRSMADDNELVDWHVGIRFGPYIPEIDKQLGGMAPGPYAQMFGNGARPMTFLDVDRILWHGFGQLGVGVSVGYMQNYAHAFTIDSKATDTDRARAPADTNTFRMVPTALTAIYRLTWFDDEYGVPVIPYARGGLAYNVWWIVKSNKHLATICDDGTMDPGCAENKARGGSLGVTGAIGLAVRGERIDEAAARSMREGGIQHAGIYAELSLAKVNGFGSDTKLSVGDRTWFAGVDFEF